MDAFQGVLLNWIGDRKRRAYPCSGNHLRVMREPAFVSAYTIWIVCAWLCPAVLLVFRAFALVISGSSILEPETDQGILAPHVGALGNRLLSFAQAPNARSPIAGCSFLFSSRLLAIALQKYHSRDLLEQDSA